MAFVKLGIALDYKAAMKDYEELLSKMSGKEVQLKVNMKSGKAVTEIIDKQTVALKGVTEASEEATTATTKLGSEVEKTGKKTKESKNWFSELGRTLKHNVSEMAQWAVAATVIFGTMRKISEGVETIVELDKAFVGIRMATGMTSEETGKLALQYNALAKELGATTTEIANTAVELYRQGLSTDEVNTKMAEYIKLSKVAGEELQTVIEMGTAATQNFGVSVTELGDKASTAGDAVASSTNEILQAMQKSSSASQTAGVTMDELISMSAVLGSTTRESGAVVGNSLFLRLSDIKNKSL